MEEHLLTEREEEQDILFGVINRFIGYFTRQAVPNTTNDTANEYPFVAMDTRQAYEQIRLARKHLLQSAEPSRPFKFIDIGCGIGGPSLEMASTFGATGQSCLLSVVTLKRLLGSTRRPSWRINVRA